MNGYSRDLLQERVAVAKRVAQEMGDFGMASGGQQYEWLNQVESDHGFWCKHDWNRGTKALREGAVDAYDTVMFRMDFDPNIDRWCLLQFDGVWYQIQSLNASFHENKIQITAIEMSNQDVTIITPKTEVADTEPTVNPEQQNDGIV